MISLSTLCTKSRIKEFLVTRKTLELHHECIWYSVCDQETADYFKNDDKFIPVKIVDKEGKHYVGDHDSAKDFFELVMNKMGTLVANKLIPTRAPSIRVTSLN